MVYNKGLIVFLFISFLLTIFTSKVYGQQEQSIPDLNRELSSYSTDELEKLANAFIATSKQIPYLEALLEKGLDNNSLPTAYKALFGLVNYYYYEQDIMMVDRWINFTDSLVEVRKVDPDVYYDAHRNRAILLLDKKEYEQAISETIKLYNRAEKSKQDYGLVSSSDLLGNIYLSSQQDSSAVEAFQSAYDRLKAMDKFPNYQIKVLSCLLESLLRLNDNDKVEAILKEYEEVLVWKEKEDDRQGVLRKVNWYRWQLYSFYTNLYLRKNEIGKASEALDKASQYFSKDMSASYDFSIFYYLYVKAAYLKKVKNYTEAIAAVDFILKDYHETTTVKLKIEILCEVRKFKEALTLYQDLFQLTQNANNEGLVRQVNSLQTMYDKNEQLVRERELQLANLQVESKRRLIICMLAASVIFLIVVLFLSKFLRRTLSMKNELENDRNALISSQEKLKKEKKKAEMADQEKDAFIANISHEIRTPLNAIVGFSTLLSEMPLEDDEKIDFIELIEKNSSLLLDLVNDVLDLSRLESGRTRITIAPCDLTSCCQKLLNGMADQLAPGVKLTFSPSVSSFTLNTDSRLLSQLLDNLLSNAAKFTVQGEINLAYATDDARREVTFIVTDTGPGIPLDKQYIIFERFEKLNEYAQGSGLGLTLCQTISRKLRGRILIDTNYTKGACFQFIHPYEVMDENAT